MSENIEALAVKARKSIAELFLLLGDSGTLERSHPLPLKPLLPHKAPSLCEPRFTQNKN